MAAPPAQTTTLVTARPGRGSVLVLIGGLLVLALTAVVGPRLTTARQDWDGGTPGVFVVVGTAADGIRLQDVSSGTGWIVDGRQLERIGADTRPGERLMGRVGGECRCRLMLEEPPGIPVAAPLLGGIIAMGALPGLFARSRWRRLGAVRSTVARVATITPVWLRPGLGAARLGVVARTEGYPDLYVELEGTPLSWWLDDRTALVHGPDRSNGLTVLTNASGQMAVASAAGLSGERGSRRVAPWSTDLCQTVGLTVPEGETPSSMGGDQRIRVTPGAGVATLRFDPSVRGRRVALVVVPFYAALLILVFVVRPSVSVLVVVYLAFYVLSRVLVGWPDTRLAGMAPLAGWPNRRAARDAAAAAGRRGFVPGSR